MKQLQRVLMLVWFWAAIALSATAQNQTMHTVKRGETLAYIAKMYGITEEALRAANTNVNDLFFVGMKLQIPSGGTFASPSQSNGGEYSNQLQSNVRSSSNYSSSTLSSSTHNYGDKFTIIALSYQMWFGDFNDNKNRNFYGVSAHHTNFLWNRFGIGGSFTAKANYGIPNKSSMQQIHFCLGPNVSAKLSPDGRFFAMLPITLSAIGHDKNNDGNTKFGFTWGSGLQPTFGLKLGSNAALMAGIDVFLGKSQSSALHASIGLCF